MKGQTNIIGLTPIWRQGKIHDAFRVYVFVNGTTIAISAKIHPTLKQINSYLKAEKLRKDQAEQDNHFQALKSRLFQELKSEHGLKSYKAMEKIDFKTKEFDFEASVEEFFKFKSDTGVPQTYCSRIRNVWLPFFLKKGCQHPKDFYQWKRQAQDHVKSARKIVRDEQYSIHTRNSLTTSLNEYLKFLAEYEYISTADVFHLSAKISLEHKKRGGTSQSRSRDIYSLDDVGEIKKSIDVTYAENLDMKVKAYGLFVGLCTGLRSGNILGLKAKNLHPEARIPYVETNDNIISGWSRGIKSKITLKVATKTFVGSVKLPMILPKKQTLVEVAIFLKNHVPADEYLIKRHPTGFGKLWRKIAGDCGFRYINPHNWKHGYATIGARNLHKWYQGNPYYLQKCCMHEDFRTTEQYINDNADTFLEAFQEI